MAQRGEDNLARWKREGLIAPHATRADLARGRLSSALVPVRQVASVPSPQKLGPDDYIHHVRQLLLGSSLPTPETDYVFTDEKSWKLDLAWPDHKIAVELHGGINDGPRRGRHLRAKGYTEDRDKMNRAQLLGWIVLEVVCPFRIAQGLDLLREAFTLRGVEL